MSNHAPGYIDGFVLAVPTAGREAFVHHARTADPVFLELGARRVVECWQTDVPRGTTTDFYGAVAARHDESVVFSWIEWPDKPTRDAAMGRMPALMDSDPRMDPKHNPMPFDGKRMIFGGFAPLVLRGEPGTDSYVQGFVIPVRGSRQADYRRMAEDAWPCFADYGARRLVEAWQDDVPTGQHTDFHRTVKAEPGECVVFALMEWPSREVCDAAATRMQTDERMKMPAEMPFDGKRMVFGGFTPVVELGG
ncbi:MAG: DUF1428 domain-containing protein [Gammaproteobacteria bacterium]|nr:DUF1428 domain-containing protein [Gammaproteobacteria bacterium]